MSSWNEETKTFTDNDGDELVVCGFGGNLVQTVRRGEFTTVALCDGTDADREHLARAIWPECPAPAPAPFKTDAAFEDVQVGDRVRVTYKGEDPTEFTVDEAASTEFSSRHTMYFFRDAKPNYTIDILTRPEPALPSGDGEMISSGNVFYLWDGPLGWKSLAGDGHVSHEDTPGTRDCGADRLCTQRVQPTAHREAM